MLTAREVRLSTSSPYFFAPGQSAEHHHYENVDPDSFGFHPSCSFYQNRAYLPLLNNTLGPESPAECCNSSSNSTSSCASSKSSPCSERRFPASIHASLGAIDEKMTDCDWGESAAISQDEGHERRFDSVTDMAHNGPINEVAIANHATDIAWALISARDSVQLRVEPQNGFVCFIGQDAASCELVLRSSHGDSTIDGRQAVLVYANGAFHLKDLNSSYGTYINERRVPSRCFVPLHEHDQVRFGFSADVYHLKQIAQISSSASSFDESMVVNTRDDIDPSAAGTTAKLGPMNKLLRFKARKADKGKSKEDVCSKSASSKLSPSTCSLKSSGSSNSSSSSATSPSSVFMSAMKMMKNRFKRKSSKDKSMVCSGNDDITFIRYDSHSDVASAQSASAPESPSQPLAHMFRSQTCLSNYRDLSIDSTCARAQAHIEFGHTLVEVEHDYDEVAREDDSIAVIGSALNGLNLPSQFVGNEIEHPELSEELENGTTSTPDSVVRESENEDEDSFDDILAGNEEDVYGHVDAYDEFESCTPNHNFAADLRPDSEPFEQQKESSTCSSSVVLLPHLNSEDRLNNNSSLDTLLTQSILVKSHCPSLDYLEASEEPDFQLLQASTPSPPENEVEQLEKDRALQEVDLEESIAAESNTDEQPPMKPRPDSIACGSVCGKNTFAVCPDTTDGTYHRAAELSPEYELHLRLSSTLPGCASTNNTCDLQNGATRVNGSSSEEESAKETSECEYDIDDIGHLRRHPTAAPAACAPSSEQMTTSQSRNPRENYRPRSRQQQQQQTLSLEDGNVSGESSEDVSGQSRCAVGGMAFVINFDQDGDKGQSVDKPFNRRLHQKNVDAKQSALSEHFARQANIRRSRNATVTNALPTKTTATNITDEVNNGNADGTMLKSPSRNRDSLEDKNTRLSASPETVRETDLSVCQSARQFIITGDTAARVRSDGREDIATQHLVSRTNNGTMKKNKVVSGTNVTTDPRDTASKASSGSSRRSTRSGQLSESAVYLINRMFEDSDYHRYCADNDGPSSGEAYNANYGDAHMYPSLSHQSMSSSRSASPYSANQQLHASSPYICNSSTASTRMEYDESMSSLHSNSDSAQRLSRLQSLATVVQSQSSQSTLEKQVDSAIDEDGDLIADDISEAGTYTVEIDEEGSRHKKKSGSEVGEKANNKSADRQFDEDSSMAGPTTNTDYEEDADCEVEDEEEDQLEIARRKIDELFNVYSNKSLKNNDCVQVDPISGHSTVNNSTFTRFKRKPRANVSTDEDEENAATSATSDECLAVSAQSVEEIKESKSSLSKKRISTELMSALKKINSKLEKTAKLGKISLDEPKAAKAKLVPPPLKQSPTYTAPRPIQSKTHSAPATPLMSENRKSFRYKVPPPQPQPARVASRKSSIATSASSVDDFDDQSSAVSADTFIRGRSESMNSNASSNQSSMRFNRAFALRRARLGMDTCGVEISEQAACKAKESQAKASPKKPAAPAFRRNDGGRFSLRVSSAPTGTNRTSRQQSNGQSSLNQAKQHPSSTKQPATVQPKTPVYSSSKAQKPTPAKTRTSYSASASVSSSIENISAPCNKMASASPRTLRKRSSTAATTPIPKVVHSDNEIAMHDGESSCGEENSGHLFTRFGRSSLRQPATSSTPWLQSLKSNSTGGSPGNAYSKQRISSSSQVAAGPASSVFNSSIQKSSSFSSNTAKNYSTRGSHSYSIPEAFDNHSDTGPTVATECVRSIPSFQMGKRFFSTKPHQMAQFDREFSSVARCSSAAASGHNKKPSQDPNLMTHSATESLLSRHVVSTSPGSTNASDVNGPRIETNSTSSPNATPPINSAGINARIFSISPLDSLVISAINQLSSKLRTRMRDLLERERSNNSIGSETRDLIDEILPQVGPSAIGMDSRAGQPKNYSHESSNISRDLSNILKNLKKAEQIFDDPSVNCQEVSSDQTSLVSNCNAIVTHASDSDTSGEGPVVAPVTASGRQATFSFPSNAKPVVHMQQQQHRSSARPISRFAASSRSPPSPSSPPNNRTGGGGFFIEI